MDFVEQVKSAVDIVHVIGEHVRLKRVGSSPRYMGLCPFHTEKTPSFSVHQGHQFYYCFGCQAKGDVFKFIQEKEGLSFFEALKLLAERNGIAMPQRQGYTDPESKLRAAIYEMHEIAARLFRANLEAAAGAEARAYLERRGVTSAVAEEFALGLSDRPGSQLSRRFEQDGFTAEAMQASGLVRKRESGGWYDYFRGRLMFTIHSEIGKIIGFGGRALAAADEPKYLNSPETPIYRKSHVLYNLHRAKESVRRRDTAVLVEGYMDVIGVYSAGVHEVVASCGTALTSAQVSSIRRHSERIVVNFDPDNAGRSAAERSIHMLLEEGMHVRIVELDGGLDPDEFVRTNGSEAYREKLENAGGYFHWLADRARARVDMRTVEGRMQALQVLLPAIQRINDKLERVATANDVAAYLGVETGLVLENFRKAAATRRENPAIVPDTGLPPVEKLLLASLLASPEAQQEVLPRLHSLPAWGEFRSRKILQAMLAMQDSGSSVRFAELEARLDDADKVLMTSLVFADETDEGAALDQARSCLRTIEASGRLSTVAALKARVKEAEREGNLAEALRLAEEVSRTQRESRASRAHHPPGQQE